jgi:glycosyltransferase involved in cell wall biosynthesis
MAPWHFVTPESPPQIGGVADFTRVMATALAATGRQVHVWSPAPADQMAGVSVHPLEGGYAVRRLGAIGRALDTCDTPRRLFVQWVPHGFGYKSLNVPFCLWVWRRARRGDRVHVMVHEPYLPFDSRRLRQNAGAVAHRLMLIVLLRAADRVWVSTPAFLPMVRRFGPRRQLQYSWLPVPSPIVRHDQPAEVQARRRALAATGPVIGYFGTASPLVARVLGEVVVGIARRRPDVKFALFGRGTDAFANALEAGTPALGRAIVARGERSAQEISTLIQCCDVFVQPYPDGVSMRRTTLMALLEHGSAVVASSGVRTDDSWNHALRLTPEGDAGAMIDAAVQLLDLPDDRARLSGAAMRTYLQRFHVERAVATLVGGAGE